MLILFSGALPVGAGSPRDSGYGAVELSRPLDPGGGRLTGEVWGAPSGPRAAGDEYWDSLFTLNRLDGSARAIAVSGSQVYVGGEFTQAGDRPANHIARWDGSAWHTVGESGQHSVNSPVFALALDGPRCYVGGGFTQAGDQPANYIARRDASANGGQGTWFPLGSGVEGGVWAIAVSGTQVYVGGTFTHAGGQPANGIARWDLSANAGQGAWFPLGSGVAGYVYAIAVSKTQVYVGGAFTQAGGKPSFYLARWSPPASKGYLPLVLKTP